jgi:hypothetical protein
VATAFHQKRLEASILRGHQTTFAVASGKRAQQSTRMPAAQTMFTEALVAEVRQSTTSPRPMLFSEAF